MHYFQVRLDKANICAAMAIPSAVQIARDIVRIDSMNPPGSERPCSDYLAGLLEEGGFEVSRFELRHNRPSLVARLRGRGDKKPICFAGHIDVVPLGTKAWSVDPFGADLLEGRLYGRGSSDMKCGVAAYVHMGLSLARQARGSADLVLIVAAAEETGCEGTRHLSECGVLPQAGAIVVAEPTSNYPMLGHRGALWLEAVVTGRTTHGSMPELGDNAVYKAARSVAQLEYFRFKVRDHEILGRTALNVGTFNGGLNINSVPDRATFTLDIRSTPQCKNEELVSELQRELGEEVTLRVLVNLAPVLTPADHPFVQEVYDLLAPYLGERPRPRGAPYFTDAAVLTPACGDPPTIIMGPGEMDLAHQTDEYCFVHRVEEAASIYEDIACRWCKL